MTELQLFDEEWLEADGLGGFASGTVGGCRSRRYHALLLTATTPPTGRVTLVNGLEICVETGGQVFPLSTQRYSPDVIHPDGQRRLESFEPEPWPCWTFRLENGAVISQELFVPHERAAVALRWRLVQRPTDATSEPIQLAIRPLLSGRDYHSLHHENSAFRFDAEGSGQSVVWRPYNGIPGVAVLTNGSYEQAPEWYRNFLYRIEVERGLDGTEDLASPGTFRWNLADADAVWVASATDVPGSLSEQGDAVDVYRKLRLGEQRRRAAFATPLERAADAYVVRRNADRTIVAGYPWFTDWGRDTFIALRGLAIAANRLDVAARICAKRSDDCVNGLLIRRHLTFPGWRKFLAQFKDVLVILLLVATSISAVLWLVERESALPYEAIAIFAIVVLNAVLGYVQESRAESAVAALRKTAASHASMIRNGNRQAIPTAEIVSGDLIVIEEGGGCLSATATSLTESARDA